MKLKDNLISEKFFPEAISVDISRIFPVMVLATMSSGKSTLINALLGGDILPSKNAACTAKVYSILDDDQIRVPRLYLTYRDGKTEIIEENLSEALEQANENDEVEDIFISGQIKGVLNTDKALLLIDTPGPNNSQDESHAKLMQTTLDKLRGGLVLYIINATQMGIKDDHKNLMALKNHIDANPQIKVLFLMNKVDEIDFEKESIQDVINDTKKYIEDVGILSPDILPLSALAANLFKMVLGNEVLTRKQERTFLKCYEMFQTSDIRLTSYAITDDLGNQNEKRCVGKQEYTVAELTAALENTGIPYLEKYIQEAQILSGEKIDVKINIEEEQKSSFFEEKVQSVFYIRNNPFTRQTAFKKNGQDLEANSHLISQRFYSIQAMLEESKNWKGLFKEIEDDCENGGILLKFEGRKIDFQDIQIELRQYKKRKEWELQYIEFSEQEMKKELANQVEILEKTKAQWEKLEKNNKGDTYCVYIAGEGDKTTLKRTLFATQEELKQEDSVNNRSRPLLWRQSRKKKPIYISKDKNITVDIEDDDFVWGRVLYFERLACDTTIVLYMLDVKKIKNKEEDFQLETIATEMRKKGKQSRNRFIFVVNCLEVLEREHGLGGVLQLAVEYLKKYGIENPLIVPVFAQAALLMKKKNRNMTLSEPQKQILKYADKRINDLEAHCEKFAIVNDMTRNIINEQIGKYQNIKSLSYLMHTGIPVIEEMIKEYIEKYLYPQRIFVQEMKDTWKIEEKEA